jgi:hypothetical protein
MSKRRGGGQGSGGMAGERNVFRVLRGLLRGCNLQELM